MSRIIGTPVQQPVINAMAPAVLAGVAAAGAIAVNDLLELNANGQLSTVKASDYAAVGNAGAAAVALTTTGQYGSAYNGTAVTSRKQALINPADLSYFLVDTYGSTSAGVQVLKYSLTGQILATASLATSTDGLRGLPQIDMLSNGNLVVMWASATNNDKLMYAILDQNLNTVKAATVLASYTTNPGPNFSLLALMGGGFAAVWTSAGAGVYISVLTNTGATTLAATLVAGVPSQNSTNARGACSKLAQLSNGNIALAIVDNAALTMGYAVFSAAGSVVAAYAAISSAGILASAGFPDVSVLPGYFCVSALGSSVAVVVGNTGVTQGASFTGGSGVLTNDGTAFWMYISGAVVKLPTTGTGYVTTLLSGFPTYLTGLVYDNGFLVGWQALNVYTIAIPGGVCNQSRSSFSLASLNVGLLLPAGDCAVLAYGSTTATNTPGAFTVVKYTNTAIVGVAQAAVAAGTPGAAVSYAMGPGGYSINPVMGTTGKSFDHSATNLAGNKGALLGAGVSLKGI